MKTKNLIIKIIISITAFLLTLLVFSPLLISPVSAFGDSGTENAISGVLADLEKDETFDAADYPAVSDDYSVQVIQIAETTDGELLVYVYQPSHDTISLTATSINISTAINESLSYKNYKLTLLNFKGVFAKYLVEDFTVKADALRYYDISSIYRAYNSTIDDSSSAAEIAYTIAKLYTACTINDEVTYTCLETEVVEITDSVAGMIRYPNGVSWGAPTACDSHFVAFSCDYEIDTLMEADVYYVAADYVFVTSSEMVGYTSYVKEDRYAYLTADQSSGNVDSAGWFAKTYTWNRIDNVAGFMQSIKDDEGNIDVDLSDSELAAISEKEWVLRFVETDYDFSGAVNLMHYEETGTEVTSVTILRLKFETNGEVYNLGVVHNKIKETIFGEADTPWDDFVESVEEFFDSDDDGLPEWVKLLITIVCGLLLLSAIIPILPYLVKIFLWIVSIPFKLISAIFKGIRNKKE